jgi:hypothetical protein
VHGENTYANENDCLVVLALFYPSSETINVMQWAVQRYGLFVLLLFQLLARNKNLHRFGLDKDPSNC